MVQSKKGSRPKKHSTRKSHKLMSGIMSAIASLLYIGFATAFYALALVGLLFIVSAFFSIGTGFWINSAIGAGFIALSLGLNLIVTHIISKSWRIHLPDSWIA